MNDPWTRMTVWGLTVGVGGRLGRGGQRGKTEKIVIQQTRIKKRKKRNWGNVQMLVYEFSNHYQLIQLCIRTEL